ncbi:MAG: radical SAM protein [Desulfuromonadales bacterium]|nr:radical SAM protein [Desulfuromonadales bacterium]
MKSPVRQNSLSVLIPTLHVRRSVQAVALAAGNLKACLPPQLRRQTELLDLFPQQHTAELVEMVLARRPRLIAFPLYLWNRLQILQLCRELRKAQPNLLLIVGGPEASADAENVLLEGELDGVICGEGEESFGQLLQALAAGRTPVALPGFLPAGAKTARPVKPAVCRDLSSLPSPWLEGILPLTEGCGVLWEVARGCRFNCAFCYDAKGHQGVRPFPLERLTVELELFVAKGVAQVWILDSTFNAPPERGKQLLRLLIEKAPQIHYHLEAKADFLDAETAELLAQLSCSVQIGLQSADPQVLKPLHRALRPGQMEQALKQLSMAGITYGLDLIYGLPDDNHVGFCRSLAFALQQQPNQVDIFPLAVLPGTELYQRQLEFGLKADPQPPYLIIENRSYPSEQLAASRKLAAATDIFYNRGRAVGFFLQVCAALKRTPAALLTDFANWLEGAAGISAEKMLTAEHWQPVEILPLQQKFVAEQLRKAGQKKLLRITEDLINYHFACAEMLLAGECHPAQKLPPQRQYARQRWRLNPRVRLQKFTYDVEELGEWGGQPLATLAKQLAAEPAYVIFLRRQGEFVMESLQDDFAKMLLAAGGKKTGEQLIRGLTPEDGAEMLEFALNEGLLIPTS